MQSVAAPTPGALSNILLTKRDTSVCSRAGAENTVSVENDRGTEEWYRRPYVDPVPTFSDRPSACRESGAGIRRGAVAPRFGRRRRGRRSCRGAHRQLHDRGRRVRHGRDAPGRAGREGDPQQGVRPVDRGRNRRHHADALPPRFSVQTVHRSGDLQARGAGSSTWPIRWAIGSRVHRQARHHCGPARPPHVRARTFRMGTSTTPSMDSVLRETLATPLDFVRALATRRSPGYSLLAALVERVGLAIRRLRERELFQPAGDGDRLCRRGLAMGRGETDAFLLERGSVDPPLYQRHSRRGSRAGIGGLDVRRSLEMGAGA